MYRYPSTRPSSTSLDRLEVVLFIEQLEKKPARRVSKMIYTLRDNGQDNINVAGAFT